MRRRARPRLGDRRPGTMTWSVGPAGSAGVRDFAAMSSTPVGARGLPVVTLFLAAALLALAAALYVGARGAGRPAFWAAGFALGATLAAVPPLALLRSAGRRRVDAAALRRLLRGEPPEPGRWVAVAGRARGATGEVVTSPVGAVPALACRYRVSDQPYRRPESTSDDTNRPGSASRLRYEGFHLVPTVIDSPTRAVRLRAMPELRELEPRRGGSWRGRQGDETTGPPMPLRAIARARWFAVTAESIHVDWRYRHDETVLGPTLAIEWVLAPGAEVCALGRWDWEGALVPHPARTSGLPLYPGTPEAVLATLATEVRVYLGLATGVALALAGLLYWLLA